MRPEPPSWRQPVAGFSLVELLVATALGLLLLVAIGAVFLSTSRNARENELVAGMQDQARYALYTLSRDLALAGYWGGLLGTGNLVPQRADQDVGNDVTSATQGLAPADDCGATGEAWSFATGRAIEFRNHDEADPIDARWGCIGDHRAGTDAFALRQVSAQETGVMEVGDGEVELRPHHFYLQTNGTVGTLIRWGLDALAAPDALDLPRSPPMRFHRYQPRIYFVRNHSLTPGDGIPTLCRKRLCPTGFAAGDDREADQCLEATGTPGALGYYSECLAEGIEDLQIVWGLDSPDDSDDIVDRYVADPTVEELETQARSAEVHLLVRARRATPQYRDDKTYRLGDKPDFSPGTVNDDPALPSDQRTAGFYRRVYSTQVQLRNLGLQNAPPAP